MKLTRLGHAAVLLEGEATVLIDPFLTDNPLASVRPEDLPHIDIIVVTHDHFDHFGDTVEIAKKFGSELVAVHEICQKKEVTDSGIKATGMNIGGTYQVRGIGINLTPAIHSVGGSDAAGVVVSINGKNVYHAGDTALFSDMQLIKDLAGPIDIALLPIGGHFTMDVSAAAKAAELLGAEITIPIHYNTWPPIEADPKQLEQIYNGAVAILDPGQSYEIGE